MIATSTSLATLLFATAALVTGIEKYAPPRLALWAMIATFVCFVAASLCGLLAARQIESKSVHYQQLEAWRNANTVWNNTKSNIQRLTAKANILVLTSLKAGNLKKAKRVSRSHVIQLVALGTLAVAVGTILGKAANPNLVWPLGILERAWELPLASAEK